MLLFFLVILRVFANGDKSKNMSITKLFLKYTSERGNITKVKGVSTPSL